MVKSCISDLIHLSVSLNDVAVDDGVSRQEPVLEVLLAEHRGQVVSAQELKAETSHGPLFRKFQIENMFPDLVEETASLWDVRGLELPQALRLRLLG